MTVHFQSLQFFGYLINYMNAHFQALQFFGHLINYMTAHFQSLQFFGHLLSDYKITGTNYKSVISIIIYILDI